MKHKIQIDRDGLVQGVTPGREPLDRRFSIQSDEASRQHVTVYAM